MAKGIRVPDGVIWYSLGESSGILVAPGRLSHEKCLLIGEEEKALLQRLTSRNATAWDLPPKQAELVRKWARPEFGILVEKEDEDQGSPFDELALTVFQEYVSAKGANNGEDLGEYYRRKVQDPLVQFEEVETTVSHLYRDPHPALGGMSYGARFAKTLMDQGRLWEGVQILEVGCGTGLFGREFLQEVRRTQPRIYHTLAYTFFDISPALGSCQREVNRRHGSRARFVSGDIGKKGCLGQRYDLVIANEMIADLPVARMKRDISGEERTKSAGWRMAERLRLDLSDAPPLFLLNIGALEFIGRLPDLLNPGGCCYIVEYGSPWAYPRAYPTGDHAEYSIHFGHLSEAARRAGFDVTLVDLPQFLNFKGHVEVLEANCHRALFHHLLPFLGVEASPSRVYTRDMLEEAIPRLLPRIENLNFVRLDTQEGIIYPRGFYVLIVEKA